MECTSQTVYAFPLSGAVDEEVRQKLKPVQLLLTAYRETVEKSVFDNIFRDLVYFPDRGINYLLKALCTERKLPQPGQKAKG